MPAMPEQMWSSPHGSGGDQLHGPGHMVVAWWYLAVAPLATLGGGSINFWLYCLDKVRMGNG